ncbi:zinc-binding dehydrogenase [Bacillus sp. EB600]|uniref:zinc-binding dehydrogenase n=1 Tax=Bacillus sp. EB600 TaxID=2806345 RepID=UPI00210E4A26|nr:zinc-binding dehydrogenase [Bacillus sp. EB600]MCQ6279946.1 zinc-binding dehydrogenase [Bacillus sp. EB600]
MKAIVLRGLGGPQMLQYEDLAIPVLKKGEVLICLKHASLNRRDVWITHGLYPGIKLPSILGADGAGEVAAVADDIEGIKIGSSVMINPALNWGDNQNFDGPDFSILGMPSDGTYAQYVKVPSENVYVKPDYLSWEEAAALPLAGLTAYRALITRGNLQKGETVLIPGIGGGVALFALQMAVAKGANVFVTSSSEEKIEKAIKLGAVGGVNYRLENWVKDLKNMMGGADLIIDGVGGKNFIQLINLAKPAGRIVNYGATNGPIPELALPRIFFKHLDIKGTTMGSPQDFEKMLQLFKDHQIHPILDRSYPLEDVTSAQLYMEKGQNFGKITLEIPDEG